MTALTVVYLVCGVMLGAAGALALARVERGPSMLDRVVGLDVVTAVVLGLVAVISAATSRTDLVPVLVVLAVVGFVGSVTVARFVAVDRPEEARILTPEEARVVLGQLDLTDEDAPVHDPDAATPRPAEVESVPSGAAPPTGQAAEAVAGAGEGTGPPPGEELPVGHPARSETEDLPDPAAPRRGAGETGAAEAHRGLEPPPSSAEAR